MKKIILSAVVSSALIIGVTGCGDSKNTTASTHTSKQETKKLSLENSKKVLTAKINSYSKYGFDINQTSSQSYILSVKEPAKTVNMVLGLFNLSLSLNNTDKEALQQAFDGAKFSVDIDWNKYASNQKDSVEVNYIGKGVEPKDIKKILTDKKVGAYLTYNNNELKKIDFKDINEKILENNEELTIKLVNTFVDIAELPSEKSDNRIYTLNSKDMSITLKNEFNSTMEVGYKDMNCKVNKSNEYLGTQECIIPTISIINNKSTNNELDITLSDTAYSYKTVSKNKKVNEAVSFSIKAIDTNNNIHLKGFDISGTFNNMDEELIKEYMHLMQNPSVDIKKDLAKGLLIAGKIYQNNTTFSYDINLDSIKVKAEDISISLDGYKEEGNGSFDKNINYDDKTFIKNITILDLTNKSNGLVLENFELNSGLKDFYNIVPEITNMLSFIISNDTNNTLVEETLQKDGTALANKVVNQGFGIYIKPIGFDKISFSDNKEKYELGKSDFDIDIKLIPNKVQMDFNNPMLPMMLISYLKADGKLVIPIKDLQELAKKPEFATLGMLMMMAKIEGENAVFVIKFENGKLLVNGQPMM